MSGEKIVRARSHTHSFMCVHINIRKSRYEDEMDDEGKNSISSGFCEAMASRALLMIMIAVKTHIQCKLIGNEREIFRFFSFFFSLFDLLAAAEANGYYTTPSDMLRQIIFIFNRAHLLCVLFTLRE